MKFYCSGIRNSIIQLQIEQQCLPVFPSNTPSALTINDLILSVALVALLFVFMRMVQLSGAGFQ